jgi:hypothetical protein
MAVNIVTGSGPRVGSSFVMQQCKANGLYVNGDKFLKGLLPVEGNPKGYYDLLPPEIKKVRKGVAKVWPVSLGYLKVPVKNVVILKRKNLDNQIESCQEQVKREPVKIPTTCEELIKFSSKCLEEWLSKQNFVESRSYYTEELDDHIEDIVSFLGE